MCQVNNRAIREQRPQTLTAFFLHKHGHRVPVNIRTLPIAEREGPAQGATVLFEEIFAYREEAPGPEMYGCIDPTTRIPSRRLTLALLNECMASMEKSAVGFGLLRIRVLGLEQFSAKHGPQSLKPFLRTAARTLRHSLNTEYFLGRWGEHEFLAVMPGANPVTLANTAETLWNLLNHSEILWWGDRFVVDSEVAYTLAIPGKDLETLLQELKPSHSSEAAKAGIAAVGSVGRGQG